MTRSVEVASDQSDVAIGERVHHLMWRARISQSALAGQIGITQPGLSKKLRGDRPWFATELSALAQLLGVTVAVLYGEAAMPPPGPPTCTVRDLNPEPAD